MAPLSASLELTCPLATLEPAAFRAIIEGFVTTADTWLRTLSAPQVSDAEPSSALILAESFLRV